MQGTTVNGYKFVSLIGRGGMAEVWKAVEASLGVDVVAIKVLNANLANNEDFVKRFEAEARIMSRLKHNNIRDVRALVNLPDGRPCIIMEYLEGADLASRMKRGEKFTDEQLRKWWNQMVDALNYTHSQGIIHRDIKPSNIFITDSDDVKLLDFGIAKNTDTSLLTITGATMGTLMYMSPEQVRDSKHIDFRTDVYSLAVSFIHLVTGRTPYDADSSDDYAVRKGIVELPFNMAGVPTDWQAILSPYLAKEPSERQQLKKIGESDSQMERIVIECIEEKTRIEKEAITRKENNSKIRFIFPMLVIGIFAAIGSFCFWDLRSTLEIEPTTLHFSATSEKQYVRVHSNRTLNVRCTNWISATLLNDDRIEIKCEKNTGKDRIGCVIVETYGNKKRTIEVHQKGYALTLHASAECVVFGAEMSKSTVEIESGTEWKISYVPEFISVEIDSKSNSITIFCSENNSTDRRTDSLCIVSQTGFKDIIWITQAGKETTAQTVATNTQNSNTSSTSNSNLQSSPATGYLNGHGYVDLGLPSGTKWANCNIGASKPEEYGNYYAWGETTTKTTYIWTNYRFRTSGDDCWRVKVSKYSTSSNGGIVDNRITLQSLDDAATANWGTGWRMPTSTEMEELYTNCDTTWTARNGINGMLFTSRTNGKSIFLPAAGGHFDTNPSEDDNIGIWGCYWSSTLHRDVGFALKLIFYKRDCRINQSPRAHGLSVRAVCN